MTLRLPTVDHSAAQPSIAEARDALGGTATSVDEQVIGALCIVTLANGHDAEGVVVHADDSSRDAALGPGRFARLAAARVQILSDDEGTLALLAPTFLGWARPLGHAAKHFHALKAGSAISIRLRTGEIAAGLLRERCRYGALVESDGRVFAVSFDRVS